MILLISRSLLVTGLESFNLPPGVLVGTYIERILHSGIT